MYEYQDPSNIHKKGYIVGHKTLSFKIVERIVIIQGLAHSTMLSNQIPVSQQEQEVQVFGK